MKDEKLKDVFSGEERSILEVLIEETSQWLEANGDGEAEDFKKKLKYFESVFHPIIQRVHD